MDDPIAQSLAGELERGEEDSEISGVAHGAGSIAVYSLCLGMTSELLVYTKCGRTFSHSSCNDRIIIWGGM